MELAKKLNHLRDSVATKTTKNAAGLLVHLIRDEVLGAPPPPLEETELGRRAKEAEARRQARLEKERIAREWLEELNVYRETGTTPTLQRIRDQGQAERADSLEQNYEQQIAQRWPKDSA